MSHARAVLVVDDDQDVLDVMVDAIRDMGRTAHGVRDGSEALARLSDLPKPCLILLDMLMYPMNGEKFLEALGARPDREWFPVVAISADYDSLRGLAGVVAVLPKPFEPEALEKVVDSLVAPSE